LCVVCRKLHHAEHLDCRHRRNVNQAPTRSLCFSVGTESSSRLIDLWRRTADRFVIAGSLVCTNVSAVRLDSSMVKQRVNGETSGGLVGDFDILHIPGAVTAIPKLGDFHHYVPGGEGFTHNALPRHGVVEIAMTCACTHGSSGDRKSVV